MSTSNMKKYPKTKFLDLPGTYHVDVNKFDADPIDRDGARIQGVRLTVEVICGPMAGRLASVVLFHPRVHYIYAPERVRADELIRAAGLDHLIFALSEPPKPPMDWRTILAFLQMYIEAAQLVIDFESKDKFLRAAKFRHVRDPSVPRGIVDTSQLFRVPREFDRPRESFVPQPHVEEVSYEPDEEFISDGFDYEPTADEDVDDVEYGP